MAQASRNWRVFLSVLAFSFFALLLSRPLLPSRHNAAHVSPAASPRFCAPTRNIWSDLSDDEVDDLLHFLYTVPNDLNLTRVGNATAWDNHISAIEVLVPNKTDAVYFLDISTASAPPTRYARLVVSEGALNEARLAEYQVGPLPAGQETEIIPLTFCYNSGRHYVRNPLPNYEDVVTWFSNLGGELSDIAEDLLGDVTNPGHIPRAPPLMALARPAVWNDDSTISSWGAIHSPGIRLDAWALLPEGLYCRFDITGRDSSKWTINEWYYNGVMYESTEAFRAAWEAGKVKKSPRNYDGDWTAAQPLKDGLPDRDQLPPVMIQPDGARYRVDEKENFVSWMGFEFFFTTTQATAVSLWNIKFKGERIIYELGLQEAMAHYAGNDPMEIGMVWMDSQFGMGMNMYELVPGYDCPSYATYLSTTFHQGEKTITRNNSICVFEYTADHPLQRHTTPLQVTISKNTYLVFRSVSTVGNYDYTIDYLFFLDGTIEVKVRASGYIFGAYNQLESMRNDMQGSASLSKPNTELHIKRSDAEEDLDPASRIGPAQYGYGYQVHPVVATAMHDHTLLFKADLDIAGTRNTLSRVSIDPYKHQYPWDSSPRNTMRLTSTPITHETGMNWPVNAGALYVVLANSTDESKNKNAWGETRGYKIVPGTGMGTPPHLTILNSTATGKAAKWAEKNMWVVKQHDEERKGVSEWNAMEPADPMIDFAKMIDGEDVNGEDLVVYFNLGTHHVPHSGDIPNTLMHTSGTSVMFIPHNFLDRDASRESATGVKLDLTMLTKADKTRVTHFGGRYESGRKASVEDLEPDLSAYKAVEGHGPIMDLSWNATLAAA